MDNQTPEPEKPLEELEPELEPEPRKSSLIPIIAMAGLFVIAIGLALNLAPIYERLGMKADFTKIGGGSEQSIINPLIYIVIIIVATAIILIIGRRRHGGLLKYAFLGIICMTMVYVFFPFFTMAIYGEEFYEEWDHANELDHEIFCIETANVDSDDALEIILGTEDGIIYVFDGNSHEQEWQSNNLGARVSALEIMDLNGDRNQDLIVAAGEIRILSGTGNGAGTWFDVAWRSDGNDYTSIAIGQIGNYSGQSVLACNGTDELTVFRINNLDLHNKTTIQMPYPVNVVAIRDIDNTVPVEIVAMGDTQFRVLDGLDFVHRHNITGLNDLAGLLIANLYYSSNDQIIVWDHTGEIQVFDYPALSVLWQEDAGEHIGGVAFYDLIGWSKGKEIVVSTDGKLHIYYSDDDETNYNYYWIFSKDLGNLNSDANGVAVADLDKDGNDEIIAGHANGYNSEELVETDDAYFNTPCLISIVIAIIFAVLLFKYPEWYIVDFIGIIVAAGVCAIIGISLAILPILALLVILAVYDAISVYKTKHMIDLADKVVDWHLPILLVIPKTRSYSFREQKGLKKEIEEGKEREAMFMGLGDIIIPGTLAISAFSFLTPFTSWGGLGSNLLVAIGVLIGTLAGFSVLMRYVLRGNPQAGLPLLNSGAIIGYLVTYYLVYQDLSFGVSLVF